MLTTIASVLARTEDDSHTNSDINRDIRVAVAAQAAQFQFATR